MTVEHAKKRSAEQGLQGLKQQKLLLQARPVFIQGNRQGTDSNCLACIGKEPSSRLSGLQIQHAVNLP